VAGDRGGGLRQDDRGGAAVDGGRAGEVASGHGPLPR
jgi:hypothetical protein